jgi:hypothetical protein
LADPRHWVTQPLPGILGVIRPFRGYLRYARLNYMVGRGGLATVLLVCTNNVYKATNTAVLGSQARTTQAHDGWPFPFCCTEGYLQSIGFSI